MMKYLKKRILIIVTLFLIISNISLTFGQSSSNGLLTESMHEDEDNKQNLEITLRKLDMIENIEDTFRNDKYNDLIKAYNSKDKQEMDMYFKRWNEESQKMIKTTYSSDEEKNVYEVFKAFYDPFNLEGIKELDDRYKYGLNSGSNYTAIQDNIRYVVDKEGDFFTPIGINKGWQRRYDYLPEEYIKEDGLKTVKKENIKTINDFRPEVNIDKSGVLYFTSDYYNAFKAFLGKYEAPMPMQQTKKYNEMREYIPILCGHWSGWHLDTHPYVYRILLNKDMTRAAIEYRVEYRGGAAELEKEDGVWKIVKNDLTWIE